MSLYPQESCQMREILLKPEQIVLFYLFWGEAHTLVLKGFS